MAVTVVNPISGETEVHDTSGCFEAKNGLVEAFTEYGDYVDGEWVPTKRVYPDGRIEYAPKNPR